MRRRSFFLTLLPGTAVFAQPTFDTTALVRKALQGIHREHDHRPDWGFSARVIRRELDSSGVHKSERTHVWKRELVDGHFVGRVLERDGSPIPAAEQARINDAIRRQIAEQKALTDSEKARRRAEADKKRKDTDSWIQEVPDALSFRFVGEEQIAGRTAYLLDASPRPGYRPRNLKAKVFEKLRGKLWIDKVDTEIVNADAEIFDTVSVGFGLLGKVDKGSRFHLARLRLRDGVWIKQSESSRILARVVFKSVAEESITHYSDFKHRRELENLADR